MSLWSSQKTFWFLLIIFITGMIIGGIIGYERVRELIELVRG